MAGRSAGIRASYAGSWTLPRLPKGIIIEEGDGFAVAHAVREANPKCVTILLTGYPALETAQQAIHAEVDGYFVKPADIESLVSTIERKLQARRM